MLPISDWALLLEISTMRIKHLHLIIVLCSIPMIVLAQNLVPNPGFEQHLPIVSIGFDNWDQSKDWRNEGLFVQIHSTDYEYNQEEVSRGYAKGKFPPHSGKAVACFQTLLMERIGEFKGVVGGGMSAYLFDDLKKPLEKDSYYRIKAFVMLRENFQVDKRLDFSFLKHFGISFCNDRPRTGKKYPYPDLLESDSPFLLDTVNFGNWVELDYIIKPTIDLKYIVIGWFENPSAPAHRPNTYGRFQYDYLVDDILVEKLETPDSIDQGRAIEWPYLTPQGKPILAQKEEPNNAVLFDFDAFSLNEVGRKTLDSLVVYIKKQAVKNVYEITGYADSIGTSEHNKDLSTRRANAVKDYLVQHGKMPAYQFVIKGYGSTDIAGGNQTEMERQQNRRVEILQSGMKLSVPIYQMATHLALTNQADSAFYWLQRWLKMPETDKILLLHDPDLQALHRDKRWAGIAFFVKESYKQYKKPDLAFQWENLYCLDQLYRSLENDFNAEKDCTPAVLDSGFVSNTDNAMRMQAANLAEMEKLLGTSGWPSPDEVGYRAAGTPALVVVHSDTLTMRRYLLIFQKAIAEGKIAKNWYATLYDKLQVREGKPQRYGTQLCAQENDPLGFRLCPLENPEKVNEWRADFDLPAVDLNETVRMRYRPNPCK